MRVRNKHVFASSLTSRGFFSYWEEVLQDLKYVYLLKGSSPGGKSLFLRLLGLALTDRGYQVDYFHKPEDHMTLEGLVVRALGAGILDGLPYNLNRGGPALVPRVTEITLPDHSSPQGKDQEAERNRREAGRQARVQAAELLKEAGDVWTRISLHYRKELDEEAAKIRVAGWAQEIFPKSSQLKHFFADTIAPDGPVDFISFLSAGCRERYLIKGAPGTGSLVIQEILNHALSRHYKVEAYHSYLNPDDPVMLIFPEISTAVIDGTGGYRPSPLPGDIVWDLSGYVRSGEGTPREEMEKAEAELSFLLAAAAQALGRAQQGEEQIEAPLKREDIAAFISRLLQETTGSKTLVKF